VPAPIWAFLRLFSRSHPLPSGGQRRELLRTGCLAPTWPLFASIDLAPHLVPGTDLAACLLASDLATHLVPGTDLAAYLLASDLATHLVPGTDLGRLFASIRPGAAPGAWQRFGGLFASI
jgi:hypothetical protein